MATMGIDRHLSFLRISRDEFKTVHLILMDLSLPEMDSWEATRILKADVGCRQIPIIALTLTQCGKTMRRRASAAVTTATSSRWGFRGC